LEALRQGSDAGQLPRCAAELRQGHVGHMWDICGTRGPAPASSNLSKRQFLIGSPRFEVPMGGEFLLGLRPGTASTQPKEIVVEERQKPSGQHEFVKARVKKETSHCLSNHVYHVYL
jgi:hypothetical protein